MFAVDVKQQHNNNDITTITTLISEFRPFLSGVLYLGYQAMRLSNFQCRDVLLFRRIVGRTVLAVGTNWGYFDYHLPFFLSLNID